MHLEIIRELPGECPKCGMKLVESKEGKGKSKEMGYESRALIDSARHDSAESHAGHKAEDFLKKFLVSLALTIPVLFYSDVIQKLIGWSPPSFYGSQYLAFILSSFVFFYGGFIFLRGAFSELKARLPGMMTLITIAISVAYLYSVFTVFSGKGENLFWELTTLITIMLLGHWIEMRAVQGTEKTLKELAKLLPDKAEVVKGAQTEIISLSELKFDDIVFIRPGGKIPADGAVIEGKSDVNESMITGESNLVEKTIGSEVIAGTINSDGVLKVKITKIGEQTFLAGVMRLVSSAQTSKSRLQILSDRAAFYLTLVAIISAITTFFLWFFIGGNLVFAIERFVVVLVIACPHALGLAIPLVASISTSLGAKNGLLIRQRLALEAARKIDIVLFDKTGTLTKGEYGVEEIFPIKADQDTILHLAASIDAYSEHMVSKAIVRKFKEKNKAFLEVKDFTRVPGKGVRGIINKEEVLAGGASIFDDEKIIVAENTKKIIEEESKKGRTIIFVIKNKEILGIISLGDVVREESEEAVLQLQNMGVNVAMITGDSEDVARWVAKDLDISEYFAKVLPHEKVEKVKILQSKGFKVAMVGDGINDAPALTQADLGIAIGAGTNVAIESAGIILVKNDPRDIVKIIKLSKATYRKMIQNLFWATGYNIVALPLAAGILASKGILLQPALAALFMSASTIIVAVNAMFLRRSKFD